MSVQPSFRFSIDGRNVGAIREASTGQRIGSGFVLDEPSRVITARHVAFDSANKPRVLQYEPPHLNDLTHPVLARMIIDKEDEALDIAVMRMEEPLPCDKSLRRSSAALQIGEWVAYGGLDGNTLKISSHEIINIKNEHGIIYFQVLGDAQPGYSGGPVFDQQGMVVGVVLRGLPFPSGGSLFDVISISHVP